METTPHHNRLIGETSPYLLQHADHPVDWYPWGDEALRRAQRENKLLLISVGYSACHWCHVMAHESFEDVDVARVMNEHFICIKVDREERPDVDQVYMNAVQLLTGGGGWPLNCMALPNGSPVYGGTYFPKEQWIQVLEYLAKLYRDEPEKVLQQAESLKEGVLHSDRIPENKSLSPLNTEHASEVFASFMASADRVDGGFGAAPKFPMPSNWLFLMRYYHHSGQKDALEHTLLSLTKMAHGGIYDSIGGGFARYATINTWNVPHFEKMLYDNGQLLSVYSEAYQLSGKELYRQVVFETVAFLERELSLPGGGFCSAIDADSNGEEGKYYVWTTHELNTLLGSDAEFIGTYFNCLPEGNWEHGKNNLFVTHTPEELATLYRLSPEAAREKIQAAKQTLLQHREQRTRPGLDDKILTAWNALVIKGLTDAYRAFGQNHFLDLAIHTANFLLEKQTTASGGLWRSYKNGTSTVPAFLDDYALTIEAFLQLYRATFNEDWLHQSGKLTEYVQQHFTDPQSAMFFYTDEQYANLVVRKQELTDNVIPASNSVMAHNLYTLGSYLEREDYTDRALQMLTNVLDDVRNHARYFSHWASLLLRLAYPTRELAICGPDTETFRRKLEEDYWPHLILAGSEVASDLPLLKGRAPSDGTRLYVCEDKACQLPVEHLEEALATLHSQASPS